MPHLHTMSLRARLIFLVLLAIIPVAILLLYTNLEDRRRVIADAEENALTRVQFLKIGLEQKVESARQLLNTLAQLRDVQDDPATCAARLTELSKLHPTYSGFGVAAPNGDIRCTTITPPRPLNAIQEKYAWFQRAMETHGFSVGDYQVGPGTGNPILTFGYPILDSQDQVQGIVFAVIRITTLNQLASETQYPEQADLIAIDRKGTILDRYPQLEDWIGKTLPEAPLIQMMLTQRQGVAEIAGVDGVTRLYAFAPVDNTVETGIYVGAGTPTAIVFAEANETLWSNLLTLGVIAALALATASFSANVVILRHVKGLVSATQRLRRGDLTARSEAITQTAELDELALAFNEMAAALEQREAQRERAEDTLREQREVLQVTLSSIGDAVIATDANGRVTFMNPIAESLTGWTQAEVAGKPLDAVFTIINEDTRQAGENPVNRVLREGAIVGLANHTLLVTRYGDGLPIDDSSAPIRNTTGDVIGVILVFRDISERRRAERRMLIQYAVARILAESDSLEGVATKVLQTICEGIGWQAGVLWRVDRSANMLRHEKTWQSPTLPVTEFERINRETTFAPEGDLPGRAWATGQPFWLLDIGEDARFTRGEAVVNTGLRAALAVPIRSRSEIVGVLECLSGQRQKPDEGLLAMLEALGSQIGNFIERKETEEALKQAEQAQRLLAETGRLLTASLDDETRLANVAQLLVPDLSDGCAIDLIEDDQSVRRLAMAHVDPTKVSLTEGLYRRYPLDRNAPFGVPKVLRTGQSGFFPEVSDELLQASVHEAQPLNVLRELGAKSAIIVPMIAHGRTLGAMTLARSEAGRRYTSADLALAEDLARRCALALDNARLYEAESAARAEAEAAQQRLAFLAEANRALMISTELNARLESLTRYVVPTLADWCTVSLIEPDGSIWLAAAAHRDSDKTPKVYELAQRYPLDPASVSGTPRVLRTGLPETSSRVAGEQTDEPSENGDYERSLEELGFKSYMIVPLKAHGRTIGAMTLVSANAGRPYTRADLTLAEELAARAALAVDNALLYQEAQQSNANLEQRVKERTALLQTNNEKLQEQIAERQRAQAELAEVQRQLANGREDDRLHLAQELHDGPVQDLYGVSYRLAGLKDALRDDTPIEQYTAAQVELQQVIHTLRSISSELRPPTLTPFGLQTAIRSHAERFQAAHPELSIHLDLMPDRQHLPEAVRLALFRIYQQMLSNVVRHAQAHNVSVHFSMNAVEATLEIQDDGRGFEIPVRWIDLARQGHLGLIGAAERAEALGGKFKVTSTPGEGTRIWVSVPHATSPPAGSPSDASSSNEEHR